MKELEDLMMRAYVKQALAMLAQPTLGEIFDHPEKWRIVRITNNGIEVVRVNKPPC